MSYDPIMKPPTDRPRVRERARALIGPARRHRPALIVAAVVFVLGMSVGARIGRAAVDPTASVEYLNQGEELRAAEQARDNAQKKVEQEHASYSSALETISQMTSDAASISAREDQLDDREAELKEREDDVAARETAIAAAEGKLEARTIYAGTYLVGGGVKPGTYKSTGGEACYWARLRNLDGELGSIIANNLSTDGPAIVKIKASDVAFETSGCDGWVRQ